MALNLTALLPQRWPGATSGATFCFKGDERWQHPKNRCSEILRFGLGLSLPRFRSLSVYNRPTLEMLGFPSSVPLTRSTDRHADRVLRARSRRMGQTRFIQ